MTQIFAERESGGGDSERVCRNSLPSVFPLTLTLTLTLNLNLNLNPNLTPPPPYAALQRGTVRIKSKSKIKIRIKIKNMIERAASLPASAKSAVSSCIVAIAGTRT